MMDMELPSGTRSAAFFSGAFRGMLGGLALGAVVGLGAALLFSAVLPGLIGAGLPLIGLAGFISTTGVVGGAFTAWPLVTLNGILFGISTAITNGFSHMGAVQQQYDNAVFDAKLNQVAGREHYLEQAVSQHMSSGMHHTHASAPVSPRHVQKILEEGPRVRVEKQHDNMADAVTDRAENAERTIH